VITVRFSGGLGNQLFQYATARALAERHHTEVAGDIIDYGFRFPIGRRPPKRSDRPFDLARLAPPHLRYRHGLAGYIAHVRAKRGTRYVERDSTRFDPAVLDLPDGITLVGYFQSERYFRAIADALRRELVPADPQIRARAAAAVSAVRRQGRPLVSVHVRRGDYLEYDNLVIRVERIRAAMARLSGADFLVFSDDMPWCRSMLADDGVSFSDLADPLEDFSAMGLCDHHIIANSTFSWWAAWLAWRPGKRVLAPAGWYGRHPDAGEKDIYADGWERY
jgi:hypothetical protein